MKDLQLPGIKISSDLSTEPSDFPPPQSRNLPSGGSSQSVINTDPHLSTQSSFSGLYPPTHFKAPDPRTVSKQRLPHIYLDRKTRDEIAEMFTLVGLN